MDGRDDGTSDFDLEGERGGHMIDRRSAKDTVAARCLDSIGAEKEMEP